MITRILYYFKDYKYFLALIPAVTGLLLSTCSVIPSTDVKEIDLSFEVIEQRDSPGTGDEYPGEYPELIVIRDTDDASFVDNWISQKAQDELKGVDYHKHIVIIIFQGKKGSIGYSVEIKRLTLDGKKVIAFTHFTEPDPNEAVGAMITSPYHVFKVTKDNLSGMKEFIVIANDIEVIRNSVMIP